MIRRFAVSLLAPRLLVGLVLAAAMGFLVVRLKNGVDYWEILTRDPLLILPAIALIVSSVLGWGVLWSLTLVILDRAVSIKPGLRSFLNTWLGRYVPGTVPYHAARIFAAESLGTTRSKVGASIAYETVLLLGSGVVVGALGMFLSLGLQGMGILFLPGLLPVLLLPLVLRPGVLVPVTNRLLTMVHRPGIDQDSVLGASQATGLFFGYCVVHVMNGLSFFLVLTAFHGTFSDPTHAVGAYTLAGVAGTAMILIPSGLGIREGVIVALMSGTVPTHEAVLAAATARAISIIADLLPVGFVVVHTGAGRLLRPLRRHQPSTVKPLA